MAVGRLEAPSPSKSSHSLRIFHRAMAQAYFFVLLVWIGLLVYYRATAIPLQKWVISGMLACCLAENLAAYADWRHFEQQGEHQTFFVGASLLLNAWKHCLARMLLLVLCLGLSVVKSDLGRTTVHVLCIGLAYFASNLTYNVILDFYHSEVTSSEVLFVATLPMLALDVVFYFWALRSLRDVKGMLKNLRWDFKLQVYERMTAIVLLCVILSVVWFCLELFFRCGKQWSEYWQAAWMFDSLWQFVFLLICTALVWLWRPDARSNLLTYTEQQSFDDDHVLEDDSRTSVRDPFSFEQATYSRRGPHSFSIED